MSFQDGILVIDKPLGITSHDVVARIRKILNTRKVGHAGTLDPEASGVMVLGINRGTRLMQYFVGDNKEYEATIRLGVATVSDDAAGEVLSVAANQLSLAEITAPVAELTGEIMQRPSSVSAIKVNGTRAHDLVRSGVDLVLPERPVTVHKFEIDQLNYTYFNDQPITEVVVRVNCSSGTYVRALARDLGAALNVGGSVSKLRRTSAGVFSLADAVALDLITNEARILNLGEVAARILPTHQVSPGHVLDLVHGRTILLSLPNQSPLALLDGNRNLIAIGSLINGVFQPDNVFSTPTELADV